ncbi:hypothetical protein J7S49_21460 [Providencia rettgeri]|uniref:hypothetical protein n=1 Tax=Providencia rettgeri TaxID=587 RepID=UPI001B37F118|nr:hypothetical protein [Providencia rettgeri]MBQ0266569.1 hypothetical protein [Providencia rettgeri]
MSNDNIIKFPGSHSNIANELKELAKIIAGDEHESGTDKDEKKEGSINFYVDGEGNVIGNNNIINQGTINLNKTIKRKVYVKTGDDVIDANEKYKIKSMLYEWVDTHNTLKQRKITYQKAWAMLNGWLKVNSYHEIKSDDFNKSIKYLRGKIGELKKMASASKKLPDWRAKTIQSIQARCRQNGWQKWRIDHMELKFNKSSLKDLTDAELKQFYTTVWNKK